MKSLRFPCAKLALYAARSLRVDLQRYGDRPERTGLAQIQRRAAVTMSVLRPIALVCLLAVLAQPMEAGARLAERMFGPDRLAMVSLPRGWLGPKPRPEPPRAGEPASVAKPAARPAGRAQAPIVAVTSSGPGQAGYIHYFLISGPDGEGEIQVGVELADQRIAWSFPGLGAVISPFVTEGVVTAADGTAYDVWHLYGLRPHPDDRAMAALRAALPARIKPLLEARLPHCENETRKGGCVSCLGFVLRALFPVRKDGYPILPRDWPTGTGGHYTTRDLLSYLSGVGQLPTREARLQRIARQPLPAELRDDLEHLVYAMGAFDTASASPAPLRPPSKSGMRTRPSRRL